MATLTASVKTPIPPATASLQNNPVGANLLPDLDLQQAAASENLLILRQPTKATMASTSYCDITSLRVALVQHAAEIAISVLGESNLRLCSSGRELRFGNRGSLAIAINGPKAGQWYDHETGEGGDLIDLIRRERCCSFRDATTYAEELIGTAPQSAESIKRGGFLQFLQFLHMMSGGSRLRRRELHPGGRRIF